MDAIKERGYVLYSDFGAVGDGVAEDHDAIIRAHEYANEFGLPVKADEGATYYIEKKSAPAIIKTDTDFRGASCPKQRMDTVGKSHMGGSDKKAENRQQNSKDCHQDDQQPDLSASSVEGVGFPGHIKRVS